MKRIHLDVVHERNIGSVRLLNQSVLPARYNQKFYDALIKTPRDLTKIGGSGVVVIGAGSVSAYAHTHPYTHPPARHGDVCSFASVFE